MLLCNAYIKQPIRKRLLESKQSCSSGHGRSNGANTFVFTGKRTHAAAKGFRKRNRILWTYRSGIGIKLSNAVKISRRFLRRCVTLSLLGYHVYNDRAAHLFRVTQYRDQRIEIMAVNGTVVCNPHVLKHSCWDQHSAGPLLHCPCYPEYPLAARYARKQSTVLLLCAKVTGLHAKLGKMFCNASNIFVDGHFIVVEDHDQRLAAFCSISQPLKKHATGGCTISQKRNHLIILLLEGTGPRHPQRNGNRTGGMTGHKRITVTFRGFGETSNAAKGTQCIKIRLAASQQLMHIRLMTYIEYQAVFFSIKYSFDRHSQFHNAKIGCQMTAGLRYMFDQKTANLLAQLATLTIIQRQQIFMTIN